MKYLKFITFAVAFILMLGGNVQALIIDDFNDPGGQTLVQPGPGTVDSFKDDASILGGERDMRLVVISGTSGGRFSANGDVPDALALSMNSGSTGQSRIQWDGDDTAWGPPVDYDGLGVVDLTEGGANAGIEVLISGDDKIIPGGLELTAYFGDASNWARWNVNLPGPAFMPQVVQLSFLSLSSSAGIVDFTTVGAITLFLNVASQADADVTIDYIQTYTPPSTVPEPGTMLLFGSGLVGVYFVRKRIS